MTIARMVTLLLALALLQNHANGFYLPGSPKSYIEGEQVKLKVNKLTSVHKPIPIDYYKMPYCEPEEIKQENENLGELIVGDKIHNSPYFLKMKTDMYCEQLCMKDVSWNKEGTKSNIHRLIRRGYHNNWLVDGLPAASETENEEAVTTKFYEGFPIGYTDRQNEKDYINNHVNIEISYHKVELDDSYRVVRVMVEPFSIAHNIEICDTEECSEGSNYLRNKVKIKHPIASCDQDSLDRVHTNWDMVMDSERRKPQEASGLVLFTYDVIWTEDTETTWASRWDIYLSMNETLPANVQWLTISRNLIIVLVLSAMIAAILARNLHRDINRYNRVALDEESRAEELEDYGWKLVHADVFRPPSSPMLFSVACGTGAQLLFMCIVTAFFAGLGFMSPAYRGRLLTGQLVVYVIMGWVNGYVTARYYKTFQGENFSQATVMAALLFPGISFCIFLIMNLVAYVNESNDVVSFYALTCIVLLWVFISIPLVFSGATIGNRMDAVEYPVRTSNIPRQIPNQSSSAGIAGTMLISGIIPFASCLAELQAIMSSVWMGYFYSLFGFLFVVFLILLLTCAEITVLFTYFQLCSEDYHWWWRSFFNAGSTAIYVFLYSIVYFKGLEANSLGSYMLYFGYMGLASLGLFCMLGFVGVSTSLWFNKTIFGSIKID